MKFNNKILVLIVIATLSVTTISVKLQSTEVEGSSILNFFNNMYSKKKTHKISSTETSKLANSRFKSRIRSQNNLNKDVDLEQNYARFLQTQNNQNKTSTNSSADNTQANIMNDWLKISSFDFSDPKKYPQVKLPGIKDDEINDIRFDKDRFRINQITTKDEKKPDLFFYFRMNKDHIYYSATETDINVLGALDLLQTKTTQRNKIDDTCFDVFLKNEVEYNICAKDFVTRDKWYCGLCERLKIVDQFCETNKAADFKPSFQVEQKVYQPIILIPQSSPICNEDFNYTQRGNDWECQCAEGKEQSPIDIVKNESIKSPAAPVFSFEEIDAISPLTSLDGTMLAKEHIKIKYYKNAVRIFHTNFGKIVTLDGTVYHAEEIVFHTPAEHLLDGIRHEMEMQVIAYGQSKGDIAKQVVLSFIFVKKPGVYNKFIDDVDFFNLPNKDYPEKNILNNLFIPKVLYSSDSSEMAVMRPISLFTYQGSITFPPCTERTIHFVAADPIPIGHAMITMLKEAIRNNDNQNDSELENVREIQPLNGRKVFYYDASMCKPKIINSFAPIKKTGHYEKIKRNITQFFFVNGEEPSGIPNTFVVTENEAKGIPEPKKTME